MKITVEIPDNEVISFIEMSKLKNYKISFENSVNYKEEFIKMLNDRASTPLEKNKSARTILNEIQLKYNV